MIDMAAAAEALYGQPAANPGTTLATAGAIPTVTESKPAPATRDAATALYGGEPPPAVERPTQPTTETGEQRIERQAETLFGEEQSVELPVPNHIKAERAADMDRKLYNPERTYALVIPEDAFKDAEGVDAKTQRAAALEMRQIAGDLGMSVSDVETFKAVSTNFTPPTAEQKVEWRDQAIQALNNEFGQGAAAAWRDAVKFVQRDPRVAKILDSGLGDHPKIIMQFARLARQARASGRLK